MTNDANASLFNSRSLRVERQPSAEPLPLEKAEGDGRGVGSFPWYAGGTDGVGTGRVHVSDGSDVARLPPRRAPRPRSLR